MKFTCETTGPGQFLFYYCSADFLLLLDSEDCMFLKLCSFPPDYSTCRHIENNSYFLIRHTSKKILTHGYVFEIDFERKEESARETTM